MGGTTAKEDHSDGECPLWMAFVGKDTSQGKNSSTTSKVCKNSKLEFNNSKLEFDNSKLEFNNSKLEFNNSKVISFDHQKNFNFFYLKKIVTTNRIGHNVSNFVVRRHYFMSYGNLQALELK